MLFHSLTLSEAQMDRIAFKVQVSTYEGTKEIQPNMQSSTHLDPWQLGTLTGANTKVDTNTYFYSDKVICGVGNSYFLVSFVLPYFLLC